ncbi:carbohydrate ABC transporter permease [Clostridium oryzae]|uniref:L-arabinose transport system permease protein AraQ n=1 Tax=Clostridium oryzae TaxID=1450648 RepID=A0A1V4IQT1_9CLOT|nr:carbohydrate ABC transporter permease [Clostridium oryzae]OPJ62155.1 L-arabinose transport system permease protein AraQ [Clostridium oryzae]
MKSNIRKRNEKILQYSVMSIIAVIMFFPIIWIISSSLKTMLEISQFPPKIFPKVPQWANYKVILSDPYLYVYLKNTIILIIGNTIGTVFSSALVAYPLARMDFKGKNLIFGIILATMMVPTTTLIIPQYLLFSKIGWLDTLLPMIVPAFFAYPYNVFLFRQFFKTIPTSIDEAAYIDGCSKFTVFTKMLVPLSKPIFVTIGVLSSIFWWNELLQPLVYVNSDAVKPLTIGTMTRYRYFTGNAQLVSWDKLMVVTTLMIIPPMIMYLLASKQLTEGIKTSGSKG